MTFTHPLALLLLLVAPLAIMVVVLARRNAAPAMAPTMRTSSTARRHALFIVVLALAAVGLAEPVVETASRERVLVVLVDRSGSMVARTAREPSLNAVCIAEVLQALAGSNAADAQRPWSGADQLAVIDASDRARVLRTATPLGNASVEFALRDVLDGAANASASAGTDLVGALELALAQVPANRAGAIIVISDGRDTLSTNSAPRLAATVARARSRGVPIVGRCPAPLRPLDVRLGEPTAPLRVAAGETVAIGIPLSSSEARQVTVHARADMGGASIGATVRVWRGSIALAPHADTDVYGLEATVAYSVTVTLEAPETSGLVRVEIDVSPLDACAQNNTVSSGFFVRDRPRALIVAPADPNDAALRDSLRRLLELALPEWELVWTQPQIVPTGVRDFAAYDLVVNGCAPRRAWSPATFDAFDRAVADATRQLGVAYAMIGGPDSFGPGGYIGTQQDAILPVDCDPNRERPAAVAFALDCSDSMAPPDGTGEKLTRATSAALELLRQLVDQRDAVGVLPFAVSQLDTLAMSTLTAERRIALEAALTRIASRNIGGDLGQRTDIASAIETAVDWLEARREPVRVAFVLSDGNPTEGIVDADDAALQPLVDRIREAGVHVHLLIAAGRDESTEFFARLTARIGADLASTTVVTDTLRLPATALEQFARSKGPLSRVADADGNLFALLDAARAPLSVAPTRGYARTKLKPVGSPSAWAWFKPSDGSVADEPFLATWRVGNGRTLAAMLPLEAGEPWLGAWARGVPPAVTALLVDALRETARADRARAVPWDVAVEPVYGGARVVVRLHDEELGGIDAATRGEWLRDGLALELIHADGVATSTTVRLRGVAPGRLEAVVTDLPAGETALARLSTLDGDTPTVDRFALTAPRAMEWARVDADEATLRALNYATRDANIDGVLPPLVDAGVGRESVRLAPWLFLAIALVVLLDVARGAVARGRSGLATARR